MNARSKQPRCCRRKPAWHVVIFNFLALTLLTLSAATTSAGERSAPPEHQFRVQTGMYERQPTQEQHTAHPAASVGGFLDAEGRLALPRDFSGSLDPAGFEMVLDEHGAPRFVAKGAAADPDARWDDRFFLGSGCDGSVLAVARGLGGELYLGGNFVSCGDVLAHRVVRFDPDTGTWHALGSGGGNGVNSTVYALTVSGSDLYVGGTFTQANVGGAMVAANRVARFEMATGTWYALGSGGGNGVNDSVFALAVSGSDLYVGGFVTQANVGGATVAANRVARFERTTDTWHALGSGGGNGVNGTVQALAVSGSDLYVGGSYFTQANVGGATVAANRVARFDTAAGTWHALGSGGGNGVDSGVYALAVSGSDLYVGGNFTEANCVVSEFSCSGGMAANRIARWDGSAWWSLGSGGGNGVNDYVYALVVSGSDLYVGGYFTQANVGGATVADGRVARFDTAAGTWHALGSGGSAAQALAVSGSDLYVGGRFIQANVGGATVTVNRVLRFDTATGTWHALGSGGGNGVGDYPVSALAVSGSDLYVGGGFYQANVGGATVTANRVARFDTATGTWHALGSGGGNGVNHAVSALAVSGSDLYVGGNFTEANVGGAVVAANRVARFDTATGTWHALDSGGGNGVNDFVHALAVSGSDLYVGGRFGLVNVGGATVTAYSIARFDTATGTWHALGSGGVYGEVRALAVSGTDLYVGGGFHEVNLGDATFTANRVARFDTAAGAWHALGSGGGNGVNSTVWALAVYGSDLYVGGNFTEANVGGAVVAANRVARFDTATVTWHALASAGGNGVNSTVFALAVSGSDLYVGGNFGQANVGGATVAANRVARFDTATGAWAALGSGADETVQALALPDPDNLYVGGSFRIAGSKPSSRIGRYTTRGTLAVAVTGTGAGSMTSEPAGLDCPGSCSAKFTWDQAITLTATPNPGSVLVGWSGGGCGGTGACVVDFAQDTSIGAEFELLTYTIGGSVTGLAGSGLVLQNNGGDDLAIGAYGSFTFATALLDGAGYEVTVANPPVGQTCLVSNGSGAANADVTDVEVSCTIDDGVETFKIGGSASGLTAGGLVLHNNGGDDLPVDADGAFTFTTALTNGSSYSVTVAAAPVGLVCAVSNASGTLAGVNVSDVQVTCTIATYIVTPVAGAGGSLDPEAPQTIEHGGTASFEVETEAGFSVREVEGCGGNLAASTFTTAPVTADCTVTASFVPGTSSALSVDPNPTRVGESASFTIAVTGVGAAPEDGQATVTAGGTDACTDEGPPEIEGVTAVFRCSIAFATLGPREVQASFSGSATHTDSITDSLSMQVMRFADLSVTADDGEIVVYPGDEVAYLIEVRNAGPDDAPGTLVQVGVDPALLGAGWTCMSVGSASCPAASGSGPIEERATLPVGSGLDYVLSGTLADSLTPVLVLLAEVEADADGPNFVLDPQPANNTATDINEVAGVYRDGFE